MGAETTEADVDAVIAILSTVVYRLRDEVAATPRLAD
jgi:hypothetical protein